MRYLTLVLVLSACDADPEFVDTGDSARAHPCDVMAEAAFNKGEAWTPQDVTSCRDGCEAGLDYGWDFGRLACIVESPDPCLDKWCVTTPRDEGAWTDGYRVCYASSSRGGYESEGCDP